MSIKNLFKIIKKSRVDKDINIEELKDIIKVNKNTILLDVRSPQEFKEEHLKGAINIPLYELEQCYSSKLKNKETIIVVYCKSGIRSKNAIKKLKKYGFKNLYNLKDGIDGI